MSLSSHPGEAYHNRSTSGTSQFSTTTTGSGHRAGSFVHPFQQTPRPYTPPLAPSYTGSLMGSEYSRDSPVFAEDEDQTRHYPPMRNASSLSNNSTSLNANATQPSLRIQTKPTSSSRLVHGTSQTNIHSSLTDLSSDIISPADTMSPASAIRSSMDKGYRIRSNSQVDTRSRAESIREARRKFEEKELAKEQKAHLAEVKAIEKQNLREAKQMEKGGTEVFIQRYNNAIKTVKVGPHSSREGRHLPRSRLQQCSSPQPSSHNR